MNKNLIIAKQLLVIARQLAEDDEADADWKSTLMKVAIPGLMHLSTPSPGHAKPPAPVQQVKKVDQHSLYKLLGDAARDLDLRLSGVDMDLLIHDAIEAWGGKISTTDRTDASNHMGIFREDMTDIASTASKTGMEMTDAKLQCLVHLNKVFKQQGSDNDRHHKRKKVLESNPDAKDKFRTAVEQGIQFKGMGDLL